VRVFENRVLRRTFGHKREELAGGWRRLQNEELHKLYVSQRISRVIKSMKISCVECVSMHGRDKNAYKIPVGKPQQKRLLRRPREDNA
jgi:hypothetical protein